MSNEAGKLRPNAEYPEMQYEIAGKEAYSQDAPVRFLTDGLRFIAFPDGHYEQVEELPPAKDNSLVSIQREANIAAQKEEAAACARCTERDERPAAFVCPKELSFKQKRDALMVIFPRAVASATAARIQEGDTIVLRYTALVHAESGSPVCLGIAIAENMCEAINTAWVVACDVVNGVGAAAGLNEADRHMGERAMADVARRYLTAKGLDLEKRAVLNWNDVASWMGYFAYERLTMRDPQSEAVAAAGVSSSHASGGCQCHADKGLTSPGGISTLQKDGE